ncbi:MAG: MdtA/MuxA family multidrug efflux RND transporter periplasmic adaptor subunit [Reyranella sp.]|uniref:MdtA/MuxA family multidrug efflux RND transporter periplasmic adaptor subunit n=1 Tax=Reyranella sp. TaxID=1929291 RepID=UPI00120A59ED|nr:MdtA/MuxA family multidrug efflux RND transporter periplasmic adaptor subunit [Reyranella sp.]TAJ92851.1 MAG: MdtA/MuxA family multidrug efflux RND transporter periplasmic adaptor subunit [Reyranella sp.]TBR30965.1 MAG: MdtA/MuxA family multidrug efflux RND transporter periplasmic adaptor subunit [Reyranella sp.]
MTRLRTLLGIGVGLAIVAGAGWYISQSGSAPPARQGPGGRFAAGAAVPVGVATASQGDIPIVLRALGTVTPLQTVNVKTQITGQLTDVYFKEGQMVKQGDLLAQVDPRPYDVALQQAIGQQQRDEALLKNAQMDLERYRKLVQQDSIARQQYDTQMSLVRQYEAALVIDQAQVDAAKLNVTYTKIVAPLTGKIGLRMVDKGNYVTMGDASSICVIIQVQPISVLFTIPEDSLPLVRQRLKTGENLEVRVLDRAQKNELAVGRLDTTDNVIDQTTGTVKLRAIFDNADESLFPNQFVNVRLLAATVKDAVVVPVAAIQRGQPGTFVYLAKADDTVEIRVVETGATDGDKVAILKGLKVGDQVVIDGVDRLRDGAKIRKPLPAPRASAGPPVANAPPDAQAPAEGQRRRQQVNGGTGANPASGVGRPATQTNQ